MKLIDSNGNIVTNRNIPLTVNLIYSSGQIVQPNTVLTIFYERENKSIFIGNTGTEIIRFRVNEVSRNHRKQLFHLSVVPSDTTLGDISPVTSIAFEVKSKRTSDARKEHSKGGGGGGDEDSSDEFIPVSNPPPRTIAKEVSSSNNVASSSSGVVPAAVAVSNAVTPSSSRRHANTSEATHTTNSVLVDERMSRMNDGSTASSGSRLGFPPSALPPAINTFVPRGKSFSVDSLVAYCRLPSLFLSQYQMKTLH